MNGPPAEMSGAPQEMSGPHHAMSGCAAVCPKSGFFVGVPRLIMNVVGKHGRLARERACGRVFRGIRVRFGEMNRESRPKLFILRCDASR